MKHQKVQFVFRAALVLLVAWFTSTAALAQETALTGFMGNETGYFYYENHFYMIQWKSIKSGKQVQLSVSGDYLMATLKDKTTTERLGEASKITWLCEKQKFSVETKSIVKGAVCTITCEPANKPEWNWSSDFLSCDATFTCAAYPSLTKTVKARINISEYEARVDFNGKRYSDRKFCAINYVLNGGTNSSKNPSTYPLGTGVASFEAPTRNGYEFGGWYTNSDFSGSEIIRINKNATGDITLYAKWTPDPTHFSQSGDTYTIHSAEGWDVFCDLLAEENGKTFFSGMTVVLAADISVTRMAGSKNHDFTGTFDGQKHKLTVNYGSYSSPINEENVAPFRNAEYGCIIKNLHVNGNIYTSDKYAAGLIGTQFGTVSIQNCRVSVNINSAVPGDGTHGGLVGVNGNYGATLTIDGCVFDGKILSTSTPNTAYCGGFVGWQNTSVTITNSLYAPTTIGNGETEVASEYTFSRNGATITNSYYTRTLGTAQGKQAHTISAGENVTVDFGGTGTTYNVSGITAYANGIKYNNTLYAGSKDKVSLSLSHTDRTNYIFDGYTASEGTLVVSTLTMPDVDVTISASFAPDPAHFSQDDDNTYTIHDAEGWDIFCDLLAEENGKTFFSNKTVKLAADIEVTRMAGSENHDFCGTFDGQGATLTVNYSNTVNTDPTAPFKYVSGATIKNLKVNGSITGTAYRAAGIVGETSQSTIINCVSSVEISGGSYTGGISIGGDLTIEGCVFNGKINGLKKSGGFVGYGTESLEIKNCLFAPQDGSSISGGTFDNGSITPTNSYYTHAFGTAQGKQAHTISAGENVTVDFGGTGTSYNVSGITAYANGIKYNNKLIAGSDDKVTATAAVTESGMKKFTATGAEATPAETSGQYTFTMPDNDVTLTLDDVTPTITVAEVSTYNGEAQTPEITVTDGETELTAGTDYTVEYTDNINAGNAATVTITGKGFYLGTAETSFKIDPKPVTITGLSIKNKTYDGTTTATVTGTATIEGKIGSDDVSVNMGSADFEDAKVGTGKTVTFSGFYLTGESSNNYTLSSQPASVTADITANETHYGALTITENQDGKTAILDENIDGITIDNDITGITSVEFNRTFTINADASDVYSTIILPFDAKVEASEGCFYAFKKVTPPQDGETKWVADFEPVKYAKANKPYIFIAKVANPTFYFADENDKTIKKATEPLSSPGEVEDGETKSKWTFTGVYAKQTWESRTDNIYGFAGTEKTKKGIAIGDFVLAGNNSSVRPFRCYLTYDGVLSKSTSTLPDRIEVRIVSAVANPDSPTDEQNSDITTPTSELTPATANVKVWSYDHTIYISAQPGTTYRIIDALGRVLKDGITATDRDEVRLGTRGGIAVVVIKNKTFKVSY